MRLLILTGLLIFHPLIGMASERHDCVMDPSTVIEVGSAVDGLILKTFVTRGDDIKKGDLIATLEADVENAALAYAKERSQSGAAIDIAQNRVDLLKKEVERLDKLSESDLVSDAAIETAKANLAAAELEIRQAQLEQRLASLELARVEAQLRQRQIRSPIDGVVITRMMGPGEFVYSAAPVAQLARVDPIHVEVFLPTRLFKAIKKGEMARVFPAEPIGGTYEAEIIAIDRVFDAASDTFGVRLALENPDGVLPAGLDCQVSF